MGIVEVKDTEQHCFYRAKLLDVKQDKCLVQYEEAEGSSAPQSWVHSQLVRREPPEQSPVRIEQVSPSLCLSLSLPPRCGQTCASEPPSPQPPPRCQPAALAACAAPATRGQASGWE